MRKYIPELTTLLFVSALLAAVVYTATHDPETWKSLFWISSR